MVTVASLTLGVITLLLCVGEQTIFQWLCYGDLLPNSCYLR
jgi:hypothetical protein